MTLYELANAVTLQGNIEIKVFDSNLNQIECRQFNHQEDFNCICNGCDDIEDLEVVYMYASKDDDGLEGLVIELSDPDK